MRQSQNLWFKTFTLRRNSRSHRVRYVGYREIIIPDYKKPAHIKCLLEFECEYLPLIDPHFWFKGTASPVTSSACVLAVEHAYEYQKLRTGILMPDTREVLNLNTGKKFKTKQLSFNMNFVLRLPKKNRLTRLLNYSHAEIIWRQKQKQADDDFAAFEKKQLAKITS